TIELCRPPAPVIGTHGLFPSREMFVLLEEGTDSGSNPEVIIIAMLLAAFLDFQELSYSVHKTWVGEHPRLPIAAILKGLQCRETSFLRCRTRTFRLFVERVKLRLHRNQVPFDVLQMMRSNQCRGHLVNHGKYLLSD